MIMALLEDQKLRRLGDVRVRDLCSKGDDSGNAISSSYEEPSISDKILGFKILQGRI